MLPRLPTDHRSGVSETCERDVPGAMTNASPVAKVPILRSVRALGERTVPSASHMGYHMVMARREVLVQLDDDLVERLDALAADLGTNRSELMRRGAQAVLDAERLAAADRELRAAYRRQPADPALVQSARRLAAETAPAW